MSLTVPERDPNSEVCHWLEVEQVWRGVYTQRFSLPDGVVESDQSREKRVSQSLPFILAGISQYKVQLSFIN